MTPEETKQFMNDLNSGSLGLQGTKRAKLPKADPKTTDPPSIGGGGFSKATDFATGAVEGAATDVWNAARFVGKHTVGDPANVLPESFTKSFEKEPSSTAESWGRTVGEYGAPALIPGVGEYAAMRPAIAILDALRAGKISNVTARTLLRGMKWAYPAIRGGTEATIGAITQPNATGGGTVDAATAGAVTPAAVAAGKAVAGPVGALAALPLAWLSHHPYAAWHVGRHLPTALTHLIQTLPPSVVGRFISGQEGTNDSQ